MAARPRHPVDRYAQDVQAGTIVAGPLVRLACARHLRDRAHEDRTRRGLWFDPDKADHAIAFFGEFLRLPDTRDAHGDPQPFVLLPWMQFIIGALFGWQLGPTRRFRDAYIEAGKGCGKTPLVAGIGLYGLLMDGERAAEIYAAAVTREQASILFRDAVRMVECSPVLSERVQRNVANLAYLPTHSYFRPVSSEHRGLDGKRPHMGLIDEIHEHPNGQVVNKMRAGAKGRPQPLFVEITNSGYDKTSICWAHHEHSRHVLEGTVEDDRWFAYVCALDEGDQPLTDPAVWIKANPSLPVIPGVEYLKRQVANATNIPAETGTVLRLNFCQWTQAQQRFFPVGQWEACASAVSDAELVGAPCYGGLDLGMSDDFSAWVRVWRLADGRVAVRCRFWLPESALEKYRERPYAQWQRGGWLEVTGGNTTDYDQVEATIQADCRRDGVREVAYDKRFAEQLALHLQGAGITMIDTPQGYGLNEGIKRLSELVAGGRLCHGAHPVLAWMADNFVVRYGQASEQRPDKPKAKDKIDGIVALVMALSRVVTEPTGSVYETRDVLVL